MKNRMPTRKSLGKISSFLRAGSRTKSSSESRIASRIMQGLRNDYPNSTKVGAGKTVQARRSLPQDIHHKRDHRSNTIIKVA